MGYKIPVKHSGSDEIPIVNGVYMTPKQHDDNMLELNGAMFFIAFYDELGNIVTPSAGMVKVEVSPIEGQWFTAAASPDIEAIYTGPQAEYTPYTFDGPFVVGRITFNGIAGASYAKAFFWRY